jgi:hypothetical protein
MFRAVEIPLSSLLRPQRYYRLQCQYVSPVNGPVHVLYPRIWLVGVNERAGFLHIYNCNGYQTLDLATVYWIEETT